ncbi:MAG TPA: hypothetical protein VIT64_15555 [Ilumatobacteraceae bacterium]|jgi:hypothetical protein
MRALRRVLFLALLGFGVAVLVRRRSAAHDAAIGGAGGAEWPPLRPALTVPPVAAPTAASLVTTAPPTGGDAPLLDGTAWVPPVDGTCPAGFPVKANANSGIFHVPGGRFYDRTVPERCYATPQSAEADGYRPAKA